MKTKKPRDSRPVNSVQGDPETYLTGRPSWDTYFIEMMHVVARRATCDRGRSGCVVVKDNHPITMGYVGSPSGMPHCDEVGHLMKKVTHENGSESMHCVRTIHAEQNAIVQAAKYGTQIAGATLYCTMTPCRTCAMLIIGVGISRVVAEEKYHAGSEAEKLFREAGVQLNYMTDTITKYPNQK